MKKFLILILSAATAAGLVAGQPGVEFPGTKLPGGSRSLTLDEAVEFAVEHNPSILTAEQEILRTQGLVIQVRAEALPQLNLTSSYIQEQQKLAREGSPTTLSASSSSSTSSTASTSTTTTGGTTTGTPATSGTAAAPASSASGQSANATFIQNKSWNVTVEASQLLYSGGQVGAALKIAKLTESSSFFSLRDTVDTVIDNVPQTVLHGVAGSCAHHGAGRVCQSCSRIS